MIEAKKGEEEKQQQQKRDREQERQRIEKYLTEVSPKRSRRIVKKKE